MSVIKHDANTIKNYVVSDQQINRLRVIYSDLGSFLNQIDNPPEDFTDIYTDPSVGEIKDIDWSDPMQWERIKMHQDFRKLSPLLGRKLLTHADFAVWTHIIKTYGWKNLLKALEVSDSDKRWPDKIEKMLKDRWIKKQQDKEFGVANV